MAVLDRISSILRANVNDMLDRAENPEAMLNQIIRDMEAALKQADSDIADQIAQHKMGESDLDNARRQSAAWHSKAELAVSKNLDDLAREALLRANDYQSQADLYQKQLEAQGQSLQELKGKRDALQSKLESAVRNRDALLARAKSAQAKSRMTQAATHASSVDYTSDLSRMERRIHEMEARADAQDEVASSKTSTDDRFSSLEQNDHVEQQLAELKQKLGKA